MRFVYLGQALWTWHKGILSALTFLFVMATCLVSWQQFILVPALIQLQQKELKLQQQLRQRENDKNRENAPNSKISALQRQMALFEQVLTPKKEFPVFLGDIHHWAESVGLKISQISFSDPDKTVGGLSPCHLSFNIAGEYVQIRRFIHILEQSKRLLLIDKMALSEKGNRQDNKPFVELRLDIITYFLEPQ